MRKRRTGFSLSTFAPALACVFVLASGSWSPPSAAGAAPLEEVAGSVEGVTASAQATVETVVPPPPAPPPTSPSPPPTPVPAPVVEVPPVKPKLPAAPVRDGDEAASDTVTETAGAVSALGEAGTTHLEAAAGSAAAAVTRTVSPVTAPVEAALDSLPAARTPAPIADGGSSAPLSAEAVDPPAASDPPDLLANTPARLFDPFIHVWPAVALTVEGQLGRFVREWARAALARFEASGGAIRGGEAASLGSPPPPASGSSSQPAFPWLRSSSHGNPFKWAGGESAFLGLALLIALATATLAILGLARRELGLPIFRRGERFPWRH